MNKRPYRTFSCTQTPFEQGEQALDGTRGNPFHLKKKKKDLVKRLIITTLFFYYNILLIFLFTLVSNGALKVLSFHVMTLGS